MDSLDIKKKREELRLTQTELAEKLGVSLRTVQNYESGGVIPESKRAILHKVLNNPNSEFDGSSAKPLMDIEYMNVPLVPVYAQGGYPSGYGDVEYIESLPTLPVIVDKNYKGKYRVFEVSGDSMDDGSRKAIYDKDKLLCREVKRELWKDKLHINKWFFVIVHRTEGITIKQIIHHDTETGDIRCHPTNTIFEDFTLNLDDVVELYNVIKIVERDTSI